MRRIATSLALALCLLGCRSEPPGEPVALVTAPASPCFAYAWPVLLLADPTGGVVARDTEGTQRGDDVPVVWPLGYVGRRDGSEIVVYDGEGKERARTGMTAFRMSNDLSNAPGAVRATCLSVTPESEPHAPEWYLPSSSNQASGRAPSVVSGLNVGRVTFGDAY